MQRTRLGLLLTTAAVATLLFCTTRVHLHAQPSAGQVVDVRALEELAGVYQWAEGSIVYLQPWNELTGSRQLTAFDEDGDIRTLYPDGDDRFYTGPGAALRSPVESRVEFQRDGAGRVRGLVVNRGSSDPRRAARLDIEHYEEVRFRNGDVELAGTLISPKTVGPHPAIILVHGSGPQNREALLPFAHFLVRRGMALLTYDKRGVGGSTGDWTTASFDELAWDVVAAHRFLKTHGAIDPTQIGLLGVSQAGWVMPLAAVRATDIAFLISVSGPGIPAAVTTIDHARNEMAARGIAPETITDITAIMQLQYDFARTGNGWDEYLTRRRNLMARSSQPPPGAYPETPDHPYFNAIRRFYHYDPAPTLRRLQLPTLALFGERDNNVLAQKNRAAWDTALIAGGNKDYSLVTIPGANHIHMEATAGSNAEIPTLRRFVPAYFSTIEDWLAARIRGFAKQGSPLPEASPRPSLR